LAAGGLAVLGALPLASVQKAKAGPPPAKGATVTIRKSVCTHCAVGCNRHGGSLQRRVDRPGSASWDSPINRGSHCAKGAAVRELVMGDTPPEISDEARRRPMGPASSGSRPSTKSATR